MWRDVRVGRVLCIGVYVNWSWLIIFALVTGDLATSVFPTINPAGSGAQHWALAVAASLLFFASVVAHELAHSVVARGRGLPVRGISLFALGGAANIRREPPTPRAEFAIAIAGPAASLALGIVFSAFGAWLARYGPGMAGALADHRPLAALLLWLGPINLLLALFNLLPGLPLDGGRVLRSVLWALTADIGAATRWAAQAGRAVALAFVGAGLAMAAGVSLPLLGGSLLGGVWLGAIGAFLLHAASQAECLNIPAPVVLPAPARAPGTAGREQKG